MKPYASLPRKERGWNDADPCRADYDRLHWFRATDGDTVLEASAVCAASPDFFAMTDPKTPPVWYYRILTVNPEAPVQVGANICVPERSTYIAEITHTNGSVTAYGFVTLAAAVLACQSCAQFRDTLTNPRAVLLMGQELERGQVSIGRFLNRAAGELLAAQEISFLTKNDVPEVMQKMSEASAVLFLWSLYAREFGGFPGHFLLTGDARREFIEANPEHRDRPEDFTGGQDAATE